MPERKQSVRRQARKRRTSLKGTVIVTGGSGLIGSATTDRLARHYNVIVFDLDRPAHLPLHSEWVNVDLTSDESVEHGLEHVRQKYGERIASVIHLAAYYDFSGEPSPKYEQVTVRGTGRLLARPAALPCGAVRLFQQHARACTLSTGRAHQ